MRNGKPWKIIKNFRDGVDTLYNIPEGELIHYTWTLGVIRHEYFLNGRSINVSHFMEILNKYA